MSHPRALYDGVIFQFEDKILLKDDTHKKQFKDTTNWGFEMTSAENSMERPRWVIVVSVGEEVTTIKPGDRVLVTALKWTTAMSIDNIDYWKTDINQVLAIDDDHSPG
jgi:hypothetical protein